jgi:hypothetical protein
LILKAGLKKHEIAGVRLYTGPMFGLYNTHLRKLGQKTEEHELILGNVKNSLERAVKLAQEELGPFTFVTTGTGAALCFCLVCRCLCLTFAVDIAATVHVIFSGLIKIASVTQVPEGGIVLRGVAGIMMSAKFLTPNEYGSRVNTPPLPPFQRADVWACTFTCN